MIWVGAVVGAYLLGSISFSYVVVRQLRRMDIRGVGSGNAGATNVLRSVGRMPALLVLALDVAKGCLPVIVVSRYNAPEIAVAGTALAAVVGHVYPVYLGFRGGKGVATAIGALGFLAPVPCLIALPIFCGVIASTRYVSLSSITAIGSVPFTALLCDKLGLASIASNWRLLSAAMVCLLVIYKHRANIQRLRAGTEPRLGERS